MGCVPPQRNHQSTASASNPIKKVPSIKKIDSYRSRNSSNSTERHLKASIQNISSSQSLKQTLKNSQKNHASKHKKSKQIDTRFSSKNSQNMQGKKMDRPVIKVTPPKISSKQELKIEQVSKIVSVHSLDIHSCIKIPQKDNLKSVSNQQKIKNAAVSPSRNQDINITFNNNNFATSNSKSGSLGMGKRWREQTLRQQLQGINEQNFKKIAVQTMPFN